MAKVVLNHINGRRNVVTSAMANKLERLSDPANGLNAEDAAALFEAFEKILAVNAPRAFNSPQGRMPFDRPLLQLAMQAGKDEELSKLLGGHQGPFAGDLELARSLLMSGRFELAKRLLPAPGEFATEANGEFDRAFEEALGTFLSQIDDESARYRIEVLYAGLRDGKEESAPSETRAARLARLAERFEQSRPEVPAARLEVLRVLAECADPPDAVRNGILSEAEGVNLAHNVIFADSSMRGGDAAARREATLRAGLVGHAVRMELEAGELELTKRQCEALFTGLQGGQANYQLEQALGTLLEDIVRGMAAGLAKDDGPEAHAYLPMAAEIVTSSLEVSSRTHRVGPNALALGVIAYALAEAGEEFDALIEGLPEKARKAVEKIRSDHGATRIFSYWTQNEAWRADENAPTRRAVLRALLIDDATCNREFGHFRDLTYLGDSSVFPHAEMREVLASLPDDHPRRAEFLQARAWILAWRERNEEEALEAFAHAASLAEEQQEEALLSQCRAYHAAFVASGVGDRAQAVELAKAVKADLLAERDRKWFDKESAEWKEAVEKNE